MVGRRLLELTAAISAAFLGGCGAGTAPSGGELDAMRFVPNYIDALNGDTARWSGSVVQISLLPGAEPQHEARLRAEVRAAAALWNDVGSGVRLELASGAGAPITLSVAPESDPDFAGGSVGVTTRQFRVQSPHGLMVRAEVKLKAGLPDGRRQAVLVHELGHALGIGGHSPDTADVMTPSPRPPGLPTVRDSNTLKRLYAGRSRSAVGTLHVEKVRCGH